MLHHLILVQIGDDSQVILRHALFLENCFLCGNSSNCPELNQLNSMRKRQNKQAALQVVYFMEPVTGLHEYQPPFCCMEQFLWVENSSRIFKNSFHFHQVVFLARNIDQFIYFVRYYARHYGVLQPNWQRLFLRQRTQYLLVKQGI